MGEIPIPIGYVYEGAMWCNMCTFENWGIKGNVLQIKRHEELWQVSRDAFVTDDDELIPRALYSWEDTNAHGENCHACDDEIAPAWCEAADPGNAGNGFCTECHFGGMSKLEDQYE
ncbi:hypothetical protein UFOVP1344_26 [uncultured Caudovirales phage]|uniref:Uncharacterized protein n=1 Tax=uncultured Caudovirales phage TaxID=2100421 RepID=A0A6J5SSF3_9CAUD|nr:hypothetical protein UFOVP1005_26 [uncultured Caudovirales phage]CAB4200081.1 hypothetical protein UFOVP1344_26 [uncultured Caudovirales phage]CAB4218170.1 hypothetical protein UFOVP1602_14 [uncultured Caudovirales phage]